MRKNVRQNPWLKGVCGALCCLLIGACAGFGGLAYQFWHHYGSSGSYEGIAGSTATSDCQTSAWNLFILDQHKENLTYLGKQDYKTLTDQLTQSNSNFRYRVLSMDGTEQLSNLGNQRISDQVSKVYDTVFTDSDSDYVDYANTSTYAKDGEEIPQEIRSYDQNYIRAKSKTFTMKGDSGPTEYVLEWGIATNLTAPDALLDFQLNARHYAALIPPLTAASIACGFLGILALCWLLASAGYRRSADGISLTFLQRWPYDLLLVAEGIVCSLYLNASIQLVQQLFSPFSQHPGNFIPLFAVITVLGALGVALGLPACTVLAAQLRDHTLFRRSILCRMGVLCRQIPLNLRAFASAFTFLLIYAFLLLLAGSGSFFTLCLAFLMAVAALIGLLWWLKGWHNIVTGGKALAEGDLNYVTNTERIPSDLKALGEDLNAISKGMQKAVDQRIRSDRFRTELITNVSHDLKTPLTSIINYVDLLKKLDLENETAQGYLEVLDRKSQRLKTLTEDLVEASKASAGVLPVDLQRMDASQLVEQALGEYTEKLAAAQLTTVSTYPEDGAWIRADGRHLWQILDNLLSNCAKYAMPGTRIYVDVIRQAGTVTISVKNISTDPLNVPAEALLQRFVRGDSARTSEGSGLGLSIAQSLANIQGAKFRLQVDGDLFKANILFPEAE